MVRQLSGNLQRGRTNHVGGGQVAGSIPRCRLPQADHSGQCGRQEIGQFGRSGIDRQPERLAIVIFRDKINEIAVGVPLRFIETRADSCIDGLRVRVVAGVPFAGVSSWESGIAQNSIILARLFRVTGSSRTRAHIMASRGYNCGMLVGDELTVHFRGI